jgi:hypothetical protein
MRVTVDQTGEQGGGTQVDGFRASGSVDLRGRANLFDFVPFDQNGGRCKYVPRAWVE